MTDQELLREFVQQRRQAAFTELARRHVDFVYGTARRLVNGDGHRAEDIAQQVFVDLARKAPTLAAHPCLTGWLYASTRLAALATLRSEQRRTEREQSRHRLDRAGRGAVDPAEVGRPSWSAGWPPPLAAGLRRWA